MKRSKKEIRWKIQKVQRIRRVEIMIKMYSKVKTRPAGNPL
jgi:hypothetical protein